MPHIRYVNYKPRGFAAWLIKQANEILEEFAADGWRLTVRQLYYQFVARDLLPNVQRSYSKLSHVVSTRGREAGYVDWNHLQDRGRILRRNDHWEEPIDIIRDCLDWYNLDWWKTQPVRVEVWVEKDALIDVVGRAARGWDCPYLANKGYVSTSAMWEAAHNRFLRWKNELGQDVIVLHLGDHDPSGIQMTEDVERRLQLYSRGYKDKITPNVEVRRIALNLDQVEEYNPPPNPAKQTDSRWRQYAERFGIDESWELDALEPGVIVGLIEDEISNIVDHDLLTERQNLEIEHKEELKGLIEGMEDTNGSV